VALDGERWWKGTKENEKVVVVSCRKESWEIFGAGEMEILIVFKLAATKLVCVV